MVHAGACAGASRHRWKTLGVATVVLRAASLALFPLLPTGFSPAGDNGFTQAHGRARCRAPRSRRRSAWPRPCASGSRSCPMSRAVYTAIGGGSAVAADSGRRVRRHRAAREGSRSRSSRHDAATRGAQQAFEQRRRELLRDIPGARIQFGRQRRLDREVHARPRGRRLGRARARRGERRARDAHSCPGSATITSTRAWSAARDRDRPDSPTRRRPRRHDRDAEPRDAHRDARRRTTRALPKLNLAQAPGADRVGSTTRRARTSNALELLAVPGRARPGAARQRRDARDRLRAGRDRPLSTACRNITSKSSLPGAARRGAKARRQAAVR